MLRGPFPSGDHADTWKLLSLPYMTFVGSRHPHETWPPAWSTNDSPPARHGLPLYADSDSFIKNLDKILGNPGGGSTIKSSSTPPPAPNLLDSLGGNILPTILPRPPCILPGYRRGWTSPLVLPFGASPRLPRFSSASRPLQIDLLRRGHARRATPSRRGNIRRFRRNREWNNKTRRMDLWVQESRAYGLRFHWTPEK